MKSYWYILFPFIVGLLLLTKVKPVQAQTPVPGESVRAVLFYSSSCGHCQFIINEILPPLFEQYGNRLYVAGVSINHPGGQVLFQAAQKYFHLENSGVPLLAVGDTYLLGSKDIPEKFPGLIAQYLTQGGVDWPAIPGLAEALAASQMTDVPIITPSPAEVLPTIKPTTTSGLPTHLAATPTSTIGPPITYNETHDPGTNLTIFSQGNLLAIIALVGMIFAVGGAILFFLRTPGNALPHPWGWATPILCLIGLMVAGYLAYVETTQVQAVCGPVGDCNTVQQSEYARLFGIFPIGILGLAGYVMMLLAWAVSHSSNQRQAAFASLTQLGMSAFGVLFSIYLTFLEPFVIGATCAWCLTSAILMTALLWLSLSPGKLAFTFLFNGENYAFKRPDAQHSL